MKPATISSYIFRDDFRKRGLGFNKLTAQQKNQRHRKEEVDERAEQRTAERGHHELDELFRPDAEAFVEDLADSSPVVQFIVKDRP